MKRVFRILLFCLGLYLLLAAAYTALKPISILLLMLQGTSTDAERVVLAVDIAFTLVFLVLGIGAIKAAMAMRQKEPNHRPPDAPNAELS